MTYTVMIDHSLLLCQAPEIYECSFGLVIWYARGRKSFKVWKLSPWTFHLKTLIIRQWRYGHCSGHTTRQTYVATAAFKKLLRSINCNDIYAIFHFDTKRFLPLWFWKHSIRLGPCASPIPHAHLSYHIINGHTLKPSWILKNKQAGSLRYLKPIINIWR